MMLHRFQCGHAAHRSRTIPDQEGTEIYQKIKIYGLFCAEQQNDPRSGGD